MYYEKLGYVLKPLMAKFRSDLSVRLRDIDEKQVPMKLKPIEVSIAVEKSSRTVIDADVYS